MYSISEISNLGFFMTHKYGLSIVKDYPIEGVNFIDINGLLEKPEYFTTIIDKFCEEIKHQICWVNEHLDNQNKQKKRKKQIKK